MEAFPCRECRAIYDELRAAFPRQRNATAHEIAAFVNGLDLQTCARTRLSSDMWKAWRRMQEHRVLTGHNVSLLGPPAAISNGN
jgi:hypothetical protein